MYCRNNKRLAVVQAIFFNKDAYWFMAIQLILNDDEKS